MDRVGDTLTAAFTRTNTDLRALGDTMKYAGPVAANLGISLEQASAMAGMLANNGLRGSDAGTALRSSLSRLASPPKAAADALKELGVSVADANGKMRPMETVLLDLFKATQKYGQVDQVSFFKNIAGEEAFVGLQTLVQAAGSGELQKLTKELQNAAGESATVAKKMADNLGGDLKELDSAWEAFRIQIEELADGALRKLTQALSGSIGVMTEWARNNPQLSKALLVTLGSTLALTAGIGATSLAVGLLLGPLAKLKLGFSLLTGSSGLGGAIPLFTRFGRVLTGPLGSIRGWGQAFRMVAGSAGKLTGILTPLRGILTAAFISPGAALGGLVKGIGGLLIRLTGLPTIMGIASSALSGLGGALSLLLSPIGLIGAAFIAAGLLIWRFWEPIKAFFAGFFSGVMQALTPFRDAFAGLAPVFGVIANAVSQLWQWFTNLFTPMNASKETLDKCASAGETFGRVFGLAIQGLMLPLTGLARMIGWILKKLDIIPDGIDAAHAKAQSLAKDPVVWEWDDKLKKMVKKEWHWSKKEDKPATPEITPPSAIVGSETGTQRRLQKIADNTGGMLDETKKQRVGPGDIVFKNLPKALAVHGAWQEERSMPGKKLTQHNVVSKIPVSAAAITPVTNWDEPTSKTPANFEQLGARPAIATASAPIKQPPVIQAVGQPVRSDRNSPTSNPPSFGEMHVHVHLHGNFTDNARDIARMTADAVQAEFDKRFRSRGRFSDSE